MEPAIDGSPFKTRGLAVAKLAELGLLPTETKPERAKTEQPRPTKRQPKKAAATA